MIRRPPRSTLFPYRRSSDLGRGLAGALGDQLLDEVAQGEAVPLLERPAGALAVVGEHHQLVRAGGPDRKSTRLNSSHANISYAVFCLKKIQSSSLLACLSGC